MTSMQVCRHAGKYVKGCVNMVYLVNKAYVFSYAWFVIQLLFDTCSTLNDCLTGICTIKSQRFVQG